MDTILDLHDIQGIIMRSYPDYGLIKARYIFFTISNGDHGRLFIKELEGVTTSSAPWGQTGGIDWPVATTNVALTYNGLKRLGVPTLTLASFPDEFIMGMRSRKTILGDDGTSEPECWDEVWRKDVHIMVSIGAANEENVENRYQEVLSFQKDLSGVELLKGHRGENDCYQSASVLYDENGLPTNKEHFGYSDGISNPFFKGMTADMGELVGGGKKSSIKSNGYGNPKDEKTWQPLETGEFILGYKDEAQELPVAPFPPFMGKNGSFLVYRKLHENVGKFNGYLDEHAESYEGGREKLAAKFAGRWRNGVPITTYPDETEANALAQRRSLAQANMAKAISGQEKLAALAEFKEVNKEFVGFDYNDDISGGKCPVGAHMRRMNPRGALEFGVKKAFDTPSALADRRRILRRGLPYGQAQTPESNDGEHGIIFMAIVANIKRQFEFVQQQWMNYGNDFKLANDKDPLAGNHHEADHRLTDNRMIVEGDKSKNIVPHCLSHIPRFVETRGGEYFFIPSLTALRMIGEGIIDPT